MAHGNGDDLRAEGVGALGRSNTEGRGAEGAVGMCSAAAGAGGGVGMDGSAAGRGVGFVTGSGRWPEIGVFTPIMVIAAVETAGLMLNVWPPDNEGWRCRSAARSWQLW